MMNKEVKDGLSRVQSRHKVAVRERAAGSPPLIFCGDIASRHKESTYLDRVKNLDFLEFI